MDRHHVNAQAASEPGGKGTSDPFDHGPHSITHGFVSDTMIATLSGEKPVQHLLPGDRVLTRDSGYQPLLATELVKPPPGSLGAGLNEVEFGFASLGHGVPQRSLTVAAGHRFLLCGPSVLHHSGEYEALATARHIAESYQIVRRQSPRARAYHHLLLGRHEIVQANGCWCESQNICAPDTPSSGRNPWGGAPTPIQSSRFQPARLCLSLHQTLMILHHEVGHAVRVA